MSLYHHCWRFFHFKYTTRWWSEEKKNDETKRKEKWMYNWKLRRVFCDAPRTRINATMENESWRVYIIPFTVFDFARQFQIFIAFIILFAIASPLKINAIQINTEMCYRLLLGTRSGILLLLLQKCCHRHRCTEYNEKRRERTISRDKRMVHIAALASRRACTQ